MKVGAIDQSCGLRAVTSPPPDLTERDYWLAVLEDAWTARASVLAQGRRGEPIDEPLGRIIALAQDRLMGLRREGS